MLRNVVRIKTQTNALNKHEGGEDAYFFYTYSERLRPYLFQPSANN